MSSEPGTSNRRRNRRGEGSQLRDELLAAALRVLEDPESEGRLSIRAVATEAGVAPQSVYLQFPDAAALRWSAFARLFDALATQLDITSREASGPRPAIEAWAGSYIDFALSNPGRYQAMFGGVGTYQPDWGPDELPGARVFAGLEALIEASETTLNAPTTAFTTTLCLWSALHGLASLRISKPSFPWPPLGPLIARIVETQLAAPQK